MISWLALLLSCAGGADDTALTTCVSETPDVLLVLREMTFAEKEDDIAWGFDLDQDATELGDSAGCGKQDLVDPEGGAGIDNALAWLLPAVENTEAVAIFGLLQDSIDAGELLVMIELYGVDDTQNDDCVTAAMVLADGDPMMGTDGIMLDGQSFSRREGFEPVMLDAAIEDGVLVASGFEILLELQVLAAEINLQIDDGAMRVELDPDGRSASGFYGGAVSTDYIMEIVDANPIDDDLTELLRSLLPLTADIEDESGECSLLSMAIEYEAVEAYYFTDPAYSDLQTWESE